jgi:hypothetical protein
MRLRVARKIQFKYPTVMRLKYTHEQWLVAFRHTNKLTNNHLKKWARIYYAKKS